MQGRLLNNQAVSLSIEGAYIKEIKPIDTRDSNSLPFLAAGIIDLQVNGYFGVDYNTLPLKLDDIKASIQALYAQGVTRFLPTIITNSEKKISNILSTLHGFRLESKPLQESVLGFHIEGPFISPQDGPRGAHSKKYVRGIDLGLLEKWQEKSGHNIKILTLSPEWEEGLREIIEYAKAHDIKISIGHSAADSRQIKKAVAYGASLSTHLGNGCHLHMHRHDNLIWQQLAEDNLWAAVIADGFHLPEALLKVILKIKNEKVILTSDTTCFGGMPPGKYHSHIGGDVILSKSGKLHLANNDQLLAGSAQSALDGISHLVNLGLTPLFTAWDMASKHPARYLNMSHLGELHAGMMADIVVLNFDKETPTVLETYVCGEKVFGYS